MSPKVSSARLRLQVHCGSTNQRVSRRSSSAGAFAEAATATQSARREELLQGKIKNVELTKTQTHLKNENEHASGQTKILMKKCYYQHMNKIQNQLIFFGMSNYITFLVKVIRYLAF